MVKKPYQLTINDELSSAELLIYGDITSIKLFENDVCAYDLAKELDDLCGKDLTVRINSYGGEVAEGLAIYNLLKSYKGKVTTVCDGFACSAASFIFMASENRKMPKSSLLMIHNAWTYAYGNANELRKQADDLEKITKPSLDIYESVSNLSREEIQKMMDDETWITAEEALEYGFATELIDDSAQAQQSAKDSIVRDLVIKQKQLEKEIAKKQKEEKKVPTVSGWFF